MKNVNGILLFLVWNFSVWSNATSIASNSDSGCASVPTSVTGRTFYVDPVNGSMANDGSVHAPWSTLHDVILKGLIATKVYKQPYQQAGALSQTNIEGVVRPGDLIYLRSGDHGDVVLSGVNDKFITVEAEPGQTPVIEHLTTYGASKWIFRSITFRSNSGGWLVQFLDHSWRGPSDNIVFERNQLFSATNTSDWSARDWISRGMSGIYNQASCSRIRENRLTNVRHGMMIAGPNSLIEENVIDHFADDGIDVLASNVSIIANHITNNHGLNDGNHNDGIQGWTLKGRVNHNVLIANNVIIQSTDESLSLPGELQGIGIFDGAWTNLRVRNNRVVTSHWHGITISGVSDSIVENNTVVGTNPKRTTWIAVWNMKAEQGGTPPRNVRVRNNVAPYYKLPNDPAQVMAEDNKCAPPINQMVAQHGCGLR